MARPVVVVVDEAEELHHVVEERRSKQAKRHHSSRPTWDMEPKRLIAGDAIMSKSGRCKRQAGTQTRAGHLGATRVLRRFPPQSGVHKSPRQSRRSGRKSNPYTTSAARLRASTATSPVRQDEARGAGRLPLVRQAPFAVRDQLRARKVSYRVEVSAEARGPVEADVGPKVEVAVRLRKGGVSIGPARCVHVGSAGSSLAAARTQYNGQ